MSVAKSFLERIEKLGLADEKILGQLRQQVAAAKGPVSAETLAKVLVEKGHLTVFQAKKIVGEVTAAAEEAKAKTAKTPAKPTPKVDDELGLADDNDGLELISETPPAKAKTPQPAKPVQQKPKPQPKAVDDLELLDDDDGLEPVADADDGLELLDDADGLELIEEAPKKTAPKQTSPAKPAQPAKPQPAAAKTPQQPAPAKTAPTKPVEPKKQSAPQTPAKASPAKTAAAPTKQPAPAKAAAAPAPLISDLEPLGDDDLVSVEVSDLEPLDSGLTDPLADPLLAKAAAPKTAAATASKKGAKKNQWDSALIWVGGGGLVVLLLLGGLLFFTISRGNAKEAFDLAEADFNNRAYAEAIPKYEKFVSKYSSDPNASLARVRMGVARIRLATASTNDWSAALATTEETLKKIEKEDRFEAARAELADILPTIADKLAAQAKAANAEGEKAAKLVADAEHALELVNNGTYISPALRQPVETKVNKILEEISGVKRDINQDKELKTALAAMDTSIKAGQTVDAADVRRALIKKYPGLETNEAVKQATLAIAAKETALVKVAEEALMPSAAEPPVATAIALVDRTGDPVSGATGSAVLNVNGSVYGVDIASGKVNWRRYIGMESLGAPVALSGSDMAVVDRRTHDLLRLKGSDGSIAWRLPVGEPCWFPTVVGEKLIVTTQSGKLLEVNAATGESSRRAVLPQTAVLAAGHDASRPQLYQLGERNSLFVLSSESLECKEVIFIGHQAGSVAAPPVATGGQIFVCHNDRADGSLVHVFSADAEGLNLAKKRDAVRLKGHVVTPPLVDGRRVYVFTDLGAGHVFDVDPANVNEPVTDLAKLVATRKNPVVPYAFVSEGKLWLGDERLSMFELQPAKKELTRRWSLFAGDAFLARPQKTGDALVSVRLRKNAGDVVMGAVGASDGALQWRSSVGVPVKAIAASNGSIVAVNASGSGFPITDAPIVDAATRFGAIADPPFFHAAWSQENQVFAAPRAGTPQWALLQLSSAKPTVGLVKYPVEGVTLSAQAIGFEGGVLLPLSNGQVVLADAAGGSPLLLPFQPKLDAGEAPAWNTPLAVQGAKATFAIASAKGQLFTVARKEQPQPHLALVKQADAGILPGSTLAQLEDSILAVVEKDGQYQLQPFALADLAAGEPLALDSGVAFGPRSLGETVLIATDGEGLQCIESGLKVRWKLPLGGAGVAGLMTRGDELIVVSTRGELIHIDAAGKAVKKLDIASPLAGDPVIEGDKLYCPGVDGAVYVVPLSALEG